MPTVHEENGIRMVCRQLAVVLAAIIAWAWLSVSVLAHAALVYSGPEDGSVIAAAPSVMRLTFTEPVSPLLLKLVSADGSSATLDSFEINGCTVEIAAPPSPH
jgi:copper transport protein